MKSNKSGFGLVEIIIACAIIVSTVAAMSGVFRFYLALSRVAAEKTQAAVLLEEGAEALLLIRDTGWAAHIAPLSSGADYYLYWNGFAYEATTSPAIIASRYKRLFRTAPTYRDAEDSLADAGAEDLGTRRVFMRVVRAADERTLASAELLLHNLYDN